MHRLIMNSEAYRMSSQFTAEGDPENRCLWRFPIQRLDAETVRDAIMAASGTLNLTVGGPPVFPHIQPEILASMQGGIWNKEEDGPKVWRRSVYVYRKRGLPGDMTLAEQAFRAALSSPDAPALAWRGLGLMAMQTGDKDTARTAFAHYRTALPDADDRAMIDYYLKQL